MWVNPTIQTTESRVNPAYVCQAGYGAHNRCKAPKGLKRLTGTGMFLDEGRRVLCEGKFEVQEEADTRTDNSSRPWSRNKLKSSHLVTVQDRSEGSLEERNGIQRELNFQQVLPPAKLLVILLSCPPADWKKGKKQASCVQRTSR